jgi:hypothetical protein
MASQYLFWSGTHTLHACSVTLMLLSLHCTLHTVLHPQEELDALVPGQVVERVPARPQGSRAPFEPPLKPRRPDPFEGTWEILSLQQDATPLLDRHDVWAWSPGGRSSPSPRGNSLL